MPSRYNGKSQAALDTFIRACEVNFRTKPTIYATEHSKCMYAGPLCDDDPAFQWQKYDERILLDPGLKHSWADFVEVLKDQLLPQKQREVKLWESLRALH